MTEVAPPPPPRLPSEPPPLARTVALDLVTRYRLRLTDPRDSRLGPLGGGVYELGAASWTGRRAAFVGFYTPPPDPALAGPDLAARCASAATWAAERLSIQGAERCDVLIVALGRVPGTLSAPPPHPAVQVGAVALDPDGDVATLLPVPADLPGPRELRGRLSGLRAGQQPPTLAAVDLAERQAVAGGYAQPAQRALSSTPVATYALIGIFVAVFILEKALIRSDPRLADQGLYDLGALTSPPTDWWRFLSSALLHDPGASIGGISSIFPAHLVFNCLATFVVGRLVEQLYGRLVLVTTFVVSALGGGLLWVAYNTVTNQPLGLSIGASAGITGMLGLLIMLGRVQGREVPAGVAHAMRQYALTYGVLILAFGFFLANVNNLAHVGGFATGALAGAVLPPLRRVGGRDLSNPERVGIYVIFAAASVALVFAVVNVATVLGSSPGFNTGS